jgi:hypothetical protein
MRGLELPEWSHLSARDARRYTAALASTIQRERLWDAPPSPGMPGAGRTAQRAP